MDIRKLSFYEVRGLIAQVRQTAAACGKTAGQGHGAGFMRLAAQVVERWIMRVADALHIVPEQDALARLQVLEGVAGVSPWTWAKVPRRGLLQARAHFAELGLDTTIDEAWFTNKESGMLRIIASQVSQILRANRATGEMTTTEDILNNVLMGLMATGQKNPAGPFLFQVGEDTRKDVLKGLDNPNSIGASLGARQFKQRALDVVKVLRTKQRNMGEVVRGDESTAQIPDAPLTRSTPDFDIWLAELLASQHPMGQQLRDVFVSSVPEGPKKDAVEAFLTKIQETRGKGTDSAPFLTTLSKELGYKHPSGLSNVLTDARERFKKKLLSSPLYAKLENLYTLQHPKNR